MRVRPAHLPALATTALAVAAAAACTRPGPDATQRALAESASCRSCHEAIVTSYLETAHFNTSAEAGATTIRGSFTPGRNTLRTRAPGVYYTMEQRGETFYQTARDSGQGLERSEPFGIVVGSGRKGQSYLYWSKGVLLQLPVSWLSGVDQWINSPGYADGLVDFERVIPPRCLECHSTSFRLEEIKGGARYAQDYTLGLSCRKCHGPGEEHVAWHTANPGAGEGRSIYSPAGSPRDQQLDNCGVCHGGALKLKQAPFSWQPGSAFSDHFERVNVMDSVIPDVHGNQVALLEGTPCFRASPGMTCSTCHDVHRPERDLTVMAGKCLACHQADRHPQAAALGDRLMAECIDCHMPNRPSQALKLTGDSPQSAIMYRSHAIGIYPAAGR